MMVGSKKKRQPHPFSRGEVIRARIMVLIIFVPLIYSLLWYFVSPWVNAYWQKDMQCTIERAMVHDSGTKSYNSNEYVWMRSPDCGDMKYKGPHRGLSNQEIKDKLNEQVAGKKVHIKAGVWYHPWGNIDWVYTYYIEGLDLDR